jgi:hypothetical protein
MIYLSKLELINIPLKSIEPYMKNNNNNNINPNINNTNNIKLDLNIDVKKRQRERNNSNNNSYNFSYYRSLFSFCVQHIITSVHRSELDLKLKSLDHSHDIEIKQIEVEIHDAAESLVILLQVKISLCIYGIIHSLYIYLYIYTIYLYIVLDI